ncbi:iron ABC transporter substrate-binding protein [Streptomyces sp. NRRL B-1347]|uniref:iron ABC transporter substrate-binding protein n=1 Tax=Streptomyces sp. NRRL B-1347 TaxID=1476877 RepID=UPI0004C9C487|nr:iron ABC transporter substrate-binding protein [Streptomyces sp. NRRL B-1347]
MRRVSVNRTNVLVTAVLLLSVLVACGSEGKGSGEGNGSSSLVIYSGRNEKLVKPLLDKLEKAIGAEVEVRYGESAELAAQILEEGERTKAGLFFSQDAGALGALSKEGMLRKLPTATLDKVDEAYRGSDGDWAGLSGRVRVIAYNPDQVDEGDVPDSVFDVVEPEWQDKVGFAPTNASFQAFVTGMRVLKGDAVTREWLEDLKANGAKTYAHNLATLDAVEDGEVSLGLVNHYYWYERVAEKGEDKVDSKLHFLPGEDPGALINVAGAGILKDSGQSATAQKAMDYLLSKEAQTYFAETTKEYPLAAGVTSTVEGLPPFDSLQSPDIDLGELESLQETLAMLQDVGLV